MKVSIIIPFHKGTAFLSDCLESLAEQTFKDFETIVVCDHIVENVEELIEQYKTQINLEIHSLEDKTGVAAARNLGLEKAKGDYVYFLDSDDYLLENSIELLVQATQESYPDVVYGKKKNTWFKKSVFLGTQVKDESDNENDEEDDENTFDDTQLVLENGGEDDKSSSLEEGNNSEDDNEDLEEVELSEEEELALHERRLETKKKKAHLILLSKRKAMVSVSVLHILIKRTVITENGIRFNEEFKYFSDFSFLVQILEYSQSYEKRMVSKYIKRKHNDPINLPALTQIKDEGRFFEYVNSYKYTIGLIDSGTELRSRVDNKLIFYYCKTFAPRLRRSKNDAWKKERFEIMSDLVNDMDPMAFRRLKGYRKALIKALKRKNVKKSIRIVNFYLGKKKLKKLIKSKRARMKYIYNRFFLRKPVVENLVVLESFFGKNYSDSPKYIYEYLSKNYPNKFKFIWIIDKKGTKIPYAHKKVKRFSLRYAYYMARAKYLVFNSRQPEWTKKRKGTIFLQTWHGTPLKKLVFDQDDVSSATPRYKEQVYNQSRAWDYLIAANYFSSETFKRCFMFNKTMLETGYPRNDILHSKDKEVIATNIRKKLNIPTDKKTILYAPTWRDDEFYAKGQYKFQLQLDLHMLKEQLGHEYVILLRTHYFIADALDVTGLEDFAYNLSKYDDISELYLISDILITDYSSVFFDYANLKRPMLFFTYDLEKYRDVLRGFYIDIEKELPGPLVFTTDEIIDQIKNIDKMNEKYADLYDVFYEKFCGLEDGTASEKVAKAVFELGGNRIDECN